MEMIPLLGLMAVFAAVTGAVARRKGRRAWLWAVLGALFTIAALITVAVLRGPGERVASGRDLPDGADPDSWLRAQAEGATLRRQRTKRERKRTGTCRPTSPREASGARSGDRRSRAALPRRYPDPWPQPLPSPCDRLGATPSPPRTTNRGRLPPAAREGTRRRLPTAATTTARRRPREAAWASTRTRNGPRRPRG